MVCKTTPKPSVKNYSDWRVLLEETRVTNRNGLPGKYDMRAYWRQLARREFGQRRQPVVAAREFAFVLDRIGITTYPGELITGSRRLFAETVLPEGVSVEAWAAANEEQKAIGRRDFGSGWDHTLADYPTLISIGIKGYLDRIEESRKTHATPMELSTLEGMRISIEALGRFMRRHADASGAAGDYCGRNRLEWIGSNPPRTFHEAAQLVWMTHIAFVSEGRYANALGRIDQCLLPVYEADVTAGRLDRGGALAIICSLWAHVEELGEVTNICVGGLTPEGTDGTNELSYICIEATKLVQSPHTNLSARFHDGTPERFHRAAFECIKTGVGFPAIFNDHVLIPGLVGIGIPEDVARDHCMVGCIETMLAGRQQAWSDNRFNTPVSMLSALRRLAKEDREPTWDRLCSLFVEELKDNLVKYAENVNARIFMRSPAKSPDPFLSARTRDCIGRAKDIHDGGAEYKRFHGVCIMGLATVSDSLAAVKKLVLEEKAIALDDLLSALDRDFEGCEDIRQTLLNKAPKYGNADPYVDDIAVWVVRVTSDLCLKLHTVDGGRFVSAMAANTSNIPAGKEVGATPDGRNAVRPLSDAASPFFGRDVHGPTAFLRSVAKPDYRNVLTGTVINMKFEPEYFEGVEGAEKFSAFTHYFVENRIPELQFNFTGNKALHEAKEHPEDFGDLVVRVSGFSAYFTRLDPAVQDDIIRRRSHKG